jgi:hypothetical protein
MIPCVNGPCEARCAARGNMSLPRTKPGPAGDVAEALGPQVAELARSGDRSDGTRSGGGAEPFHDLHLFSLDDELLPLEFEEVVQLGRAEFVDLQVEASDL